MPSSRAVLRCVAARVPRGTGTDAPDDLDPNGDFTDPTRATYRSAARRLRGRFAGDPVRLQQSLLKLARREDARRMAAEPLSREPSVRPLQSLVDEGVAGRFAALVRQHLHGAVLCYADRQSLMAAAGRLGIGRFEANLIIAAVQHRAEGEHFPNRIGPMECSPATSGWWSAVGLVLAVETTFSLVAWWALCR